MHRKSGCPTEGSEKHSNSRRKNIGYDWSNGIPAWTSVTDCKGILNGVEMHSCEQLWPTEADTYSARHHSASQQPTSHHQETNAEDRRRVSATCRNDNSKDATRDELLHKDRNGQNDDEKPSSIRSKEPSDHNSNQMNQISIRSLSRGYVCQNSDHGLLLVK
jgi:hypothetical protein